MDVAAEQLSYVIRRLVPFTEHMISVSAFTIMGEGPPTVLHVRTHEQGLKKYTKYKMRVAASTNVGESSLSEENDIFVRTPEDEPESSPQDVEVTDVTASEISLKWLPPEKPNGVIVAYEVLCKNLDTLFMKNTSTTDVILRGLKPYTLYNISVRSYTRVGHGNRLSSLLSVRTSETGLKKYSQYMIEVSASTVEGEGVRSAPLSVLTEEDAPDSPPQDFSVKQLSGVTVKLSWQPPLEPNGIILYYTVYVWDRSSLKTLNVTETSLEVSDLDYNVEYTAYVTASTRFGDGKTRSNIINFRTPEGGQQGFFRTRVVFYESEIHVPCMDTAMNISGFQTEAKLVGLEPVSTYSISISAFTKVGNGNQFSNVVKFTTQESVPDVVQNVQCMATSWQSALVKWDPPKKPNGIITHYTVTVEGNATEVSSQDHGYTCMKLIANTSYAFKIRAATSAGEGDESTCNISTLPETVPSVPTNIAFSNIQSTSATLTWMRPDSIFGYFQNYKITTQLRAQKCGEWESEECVEYQKIQYLYEADLTEETIYGLKKYRWYRFQVAASTNAGYGNASSWISTQTLPGRK
ncbi:hypothetical protein CB1_000394039 [Camelus ferus]|nr:hypothetical protein CB1_000394039 [Camelus ferus]